ncbi:hypothetical protein, partial [Paenibacillus sp. Y412MC10]|uniref:hypothetical protein n=1 Tax=Geobacillus sp. (strain Y412MC10) TaxID=481743 RepID=UPI001C9307A0
VGKEGMEVWCEVGVANVEMGMMMVRGKEGEMKATVIWKRMKVMKGRGKEGIGVEGMGWGGGGVKGWGGVWR